MTSTLAVGTSESFAEVEGLSVTYRAEGRNVPVLRDVSLRLNAGDAVGLVGESGCGKSTLASVLVGHLRPGSRVVAGSVRIAGKDILAATGASLRTLRRTQLGFVPQNAGQSLTPSMRVGRQVAEVLQACGQCGRRDARTHAAALLRQVRLPQPEVLLDRFPHQLSGGQQQRVAVALALAGRPRLLVLDEPTTGLDVVTQLGLLALLNRLRAELGITLVMVSHDMRAVAAVCDQVIVMYASRVVEGGPTGRVFGQPAHPYTRGLLASMPSLSRPGLPVGLPGAVGAAAELEGCGFAPRCPHAQDICRAGAGPALTELVPLLTETATPTRRTVACLRSAELPDAPDLTPPAAEPRGGVHRRELLRVNNLTVDYRRRADEHSGPTVSDISLTVNEGEVVALVGESGSGKSTIAWTVAGLRRLTSGRVTLADRDGGTPTEANLSLPAAKRDPLVRRKVQLVFQNAATALNPRRTTGDTVGRPLRLRGIRGTAQRADVELLLADVGLEPAHAARRPGQLSGGQQQRIGIARALAAEPALVLADEIVSALDMSVQASVLRLLDDLRRRRGLGILFISHDLAVVRGLADRVVVLYLGRVCEEGPADRVFGPVSHPYTRLLVDCVRALDLGAGSAVPGIDDEPEAFPPPHGCAFRLRCPLRIAGTCDKQPPPPRDMGGGHRIYCHHSIADLEVQA